MPLPIEKKLERIRYNFKYENGQERNFDIFIEPSTYNVIRTAKELPSEWTELKDFKCPHCPLDENEFKYCPVAVNLEDIINFFSDISSFEQVKITVESERRNYSKITSTQEGVSSIIGILMVISGCPILGNLKPMVRFHLPFCSIQETEVRAYSLYLLAQFMKAKNGDAPDWKMNNLKKVYEDLTILNRSIAQKIADLETKDASINAVIILNNFASSVTFSIEENDFEYIEPLLKEFMK